MPAPVFASINQPLTSNAAMDGRGVALYRKYSATPKPERRLSGGRGSKGAGRLCPLEKLLLRLRTLKRIPGQPDLPGRPVAGAPEYRQLARRAWHQHC
jgi:hypothetical protein